MRDFRLDPPDPVLLWATVLMIWLIPVTILVVSVAAVVGVRRRNRNARALTNDPVSTQWLAEARSREEQHW